MDFVVYCKDENLLEGKIPVKSRIKVDKLFTIEKMPKTFIELKEINGIGPAKIDKYGEEILRIVNA